jgi:acylphosphatase
MRRMERRRSERRLHAIITGRVQGVGFREFVRHQAVSRGLTGFVRNGDDGRTVEVVAEGDEAALEDLVRQLHDGPRFSRVESVDFTWSEAGGGFSKFGVEM